ARCPYNNGTAEPFWALTGLIPCQGACPAMSADARPIHGPEQSSPPRAPVPTHDSAAKLADYFQQAVGEYLIRHRSVLDVLSNMQEASARVQRDRKSTRLNSSHV